MLLGDFEALSLHPGVGVYGSKEKKKHTHTQATLLANLAVFLFIDISNSVRIRGPPGMSWPQMYNSFPISGLIYDGPV